MATIMNDYLDTQSTQSVFSAALPYAVGSLALGAGGTYVAVTNVGAASPVLPIAAAIVALIGVYGFFSTVMTAMYSKNSSDFYHKIGPALQIGALAVVTEVMALAAKVVLERLIERMIFGRR